MRPIRLFTCLLVTILLVVNSCSTKRAEEKKGLNGAVNEGIKEEIITLINKRMSERGITALSVAVVAGNEVLITDGFGKARIGTEEESEVLADKKTLFQIGSASKVFTATAVMQLHQTGVINIDNPITNYIPELTFKGSEYNVKDITVRHLLTHQSGIPSLRLNGFFLPEPDNSKFMALPEVLSNEYLTWEPGLITAYNNTGISILGILISRVTGMSFDEYITQNIFNRVGMENSQTNLPVNSNAIIARGYIAGSPMPTLSITDVPAGAFLSSAEDMGRFITTLLGDYTDENNKILKKEILNEMFRKQNHGIVYDGKTSMGLTYFLHSINNELVVGHDGDLPPFHTTLKIMPDRGLGVYISSNDELTSQMNVVKIGNEVLELLYKRTTGLVVNESLVQNTESNRIIDSSNYAKYIGNYAAGNFGLISIENNSDKIEIEVMGMRGELIPFSDESFIINGFEFISFRPGKEHKGLEVYFQNSFVGVAFNVPETELNSFGKSFIGKYKVLDKSDELLAKGLEIFYDNNKKLLLVKLESTLATMVFPVSQSNNLLKGYGIGRSQGQSLYIDNNILNYAGVKWIQLK